MVLWSACLDSCTGKSNDTDQHDTDLFFFVMISRSLYNKCDRY